MPFTCFDASKYAALLLVDSEEVCLFLWHWMESEAWTMHDVVLDKHKYANETRFVFSLVSPSRNTQNRRYRN